MLLCFSMAGAVGGGLYEHMVLMPLWAASPPSSLAMIQPGTGVPLQEFWIPVHVAITVCLLVSLILAWKARRFLLIGLGSYVIMRVWSGLFFIPEMLAFQKAGRDLLLHDGVGFAGLFAEHLEGHSATEDADHLTLTGLAHDRDSRLRLGKNVLAFGH
jgi:hypothetical protein